MTQEAPGGEGRDPLAAALVGLTAFTGVIDAVSFLGLGRIFTAFMTGNFLFLGLVAAGTSGLEPAACLTAIVAFVFGAVTGSRIMATAADPRRALLVSASVVCLALLAAALTGIGLQPVRQSPDPRHYPVIVFTAVAMGVRSATIIRLRAGLKTTLVTFTMVSMIMDSFIGRGTGHPQQAYRFAAVVAVFVGGVAGALLLRVGLSFALLVAAVGGFLTVTAYLLHPASKRPPGW